MVRQPDSLSVPERLQIAERILGHRFADQELLQRALTHPSAIEDRDPTAYYERLEFLGDSVLGLYVAEEIYRRYPTMDEGGMTRIKVSLVNGSTLRGVADKLGLGDALIFGDSMTGTGTRGLASALENVFEALTAALYLDAGPEFARGWVMSTLAPLISEEAAAAPQNPKSLLQELAQSRGESPTYRITSQDGPSHDRTFTAVVELAGLEVGQGIGRTKREAEAAAAAAALDGFGSA